MEHVPPLLRLDQAPEVEVGDGLRWVPLRSLGATAFGTNAFRAAAPGVEVVVDHRETEPSAAGHEELYVVVSGAVLFTVGDVERRAEAGSLILVPVGVRRRAVALEAGATVVIVGGAPGAAAAAAPWEVSERAAHGLPPAE